MMASTNADGAGGDSVVANFGDSPFVDEPPSLLTTNANVTQIAVEEWASVVTAPTRQLQRATVLA